MAKKSQIEKNKKRSTLAHQHRDRRHKLRMMVRDSSLTAEERFQATLRLAQMPRNSSPTRIRNRCALSGRPRGYYRDFRVSRIALRELAATAQIPGLTKASW